MLSLYNLTALFPNATSGKQNLPYERAVYFPHSARDYNARVLVKLQHVKSHINYGPSGFIPPGYIMSCCEAPWRELLMNIHYH